MWRFLSLSLLLPQQPLPSHASLPFLRSFQRGAGDQSWPFFQNGQEWEMYLVNHFFETRKDPPTPPLPSSFCLFFSPCYPHPPEALPATSSGSLLICRENKLVVLFRRWMGGKGLGNIVRAILASDGLTPRAPRHEALPEHHLSETACAYALR